MLLFVILVRFLWRGSLGSGAGAAEAGLVTFLTVIGPVAFDAHLVGFLVPTSGPFREDLKGDVTARACRFLYPIRL